MPESSERMDLQQAIDQLVALGFADPIEIVKKLRSQHGDDWLREQGAAHAEDFAAELARRALGSVRRKAEVALRPGAQLTRSEMLIVKTPIPTSDGTWEWKPVGEVTIPDLLAKERWYVGLARASLKRAVWCRITRRLMEQEGVERVKELTAPLPSLPEDDDPELELPPVEVAA